VSAAAAAAAASRGLCKNERDFMLQLTNEIGKIERNQTVTSYKKRL
jgi:hypothetical protein